MSRQKLSQLLKQILGSNAVYYQRPPNTGMEYPCILYTIDDVDVQHADNRGYIQTDRYLLTVIDRNPDSSIWRELLKLPSASFVRAYPADQLNHTLINLHF